MPVLKKRAQGNTEHIVHKADGLYIHSSPPRVLQLNSAHIKQFIRGGDIDKLEQIVLEGQGKCLLGEYSADYKVRTFLKSVPATMSKIALLHDAVNSGRLEELKTLLDEEPSKRKKLILAKDEAGVGLLHKAVYYDLKNIYKYIVDNFPHAVSQRDSEGRTPLHYTPMCKDSKGVEKILINAGADPSILDFKQHSVKYYMDHRMELELPSPHKSALTSAKAPLNHLDGLNFKKSNIRIWIHQRNLTNLQQVVWEGHGSKLLVEHSNNNKIKRFLEAVPHIMGLIKDIHTDVHNDDLETLKKHLTPPIPPIVLSGKDSNGLTPLHKAAGLGKQEIAEYIVEQYPKSLNITDNEGRTPLHYAAILKDDGKMMKFLLDNGADESALDNKQKTAAYYKNRNSELDTKVLNVIPDCPRNAKESFLSSWDWSILTANTPVDEIKHIVKKISNGVEKKEDKVQEEQSKEEDKMERHETEEIDANDNKSSNNDDEKAKKESELIIEEPKDEIKENTPPVSPEKTASRPGSENHTNGEEHEDAVNENEHEETSTRPSTNNRTDSRPSTANKAESRPNSITAVEEASATPSLTTSAKQLKQRSESSKSNYSEHNNNNNEEVGVIEGVVNGEDEIETLNEEGQRKKYDDDISALVEEGNMEKLAGIVLNGDGEKLVGQHSSNPELQTFLDNVPNYMSKIHRIHLAARNGSLRDLQAALDRRKFAIAKDNISPNGATPLHTSIIFGNTSIVRYLAGRFPETLQMTDDNGRTPLHYAAVLADNGHYYNLLMHLGADTRTKDKFDHTPDYYRKHQDTFSHKSLLNDFGADELDPDDMLTDKVPNDTVSARKNLDDEDMIGVLEKCFNVLHGRRCSNAISASSISSSLLQTPQGNLLTKHLKRYIFDTIKFRLTKLDHNLYDLIWPSVKKLPNDTSFRMALEQDFPLGILAPDYYSYRVFSEILEPIIKDVNSLDLHQDLPNQPPIMFFNNDYEDTNNDKIVHLDLDPGNRWILSDTNSNGQVDMPFFATEEGRYLASSLGDPLIKGLTEVANKRPEDPIAYLATYLYNFANSRQIQSKSDKIVQQETVQTVNGSPEKDNNTAVPASIDVVTLEPDEETDENSAFNSTTRDEHGQSMLHFAAARAHGRNALFQLLIETDINVAFRDELYRTARDISVQANLPENTAEIDRYILHLATKGDSDKLVELLLDGYDHITDVVDENGVSIVEVASNHNQSEVVSFLQSILTFEEKRERVHHAIRLGSITDVTELLADEKDTGSGKLLAIGRNSYGRCSLHIAVLCQQEEIVDYLANNFSETLKLGDNLERTALHYAMGVDKMEVISRVLIKAGSKRVVKDLKGRQPSYYFLNKSDILRLQEEEETF